MKKLYLLSFALLALGLNSEVSPSKIAEIQSEISSMSPTELQDRRASLLLEQSELEDQQKGT